MRRGLFYLLMATLAVLTPMGACAHAFSPSVGEDQTAETPMDLFLGMDYDENYSYIGSDSLLYRFPGLIMVENDALWYDDYDEEDDLHVKFRFSMGMYIDKEYPSEAIFRKMEGAIDSALVFGMEPYGGMDNKPAFRLRESHKPQNAREMLDFGTQVFNMYTQQKRARKPESAYEQIPEGRWCLVAHKVYDKGDQATYMVVVSYDINGSNGCPSQALYWTLDKKTGRLLQSKDIIAKYDEEDLKNQLWDAYIEACKERGYDEDMIMLEPENLLTEVSGCAIINEGILFYYLPYIIGSGAEGEYFLVLKKK